MYKSRFFKVYFFNILSAASNILFVYESTYFLGYEQYGIFVLLSSVMSMMLNIIGTRTSEAVTFFYKTNENKNDIVFSGFTIDFMMGFIYVFVSLIVFSILKNFDVWQTLTLSGMMYYSMYVFFQILFGTAQGVWIATDKYHVINIIQFISSVIRVIVLYLLIMNQFKSYESIAISYGLSGLVFIPFIVKNLIGHNFSLIRKICFVDGFLNYSAKTFISSLLKGGNKSIDNIIIGVVFDHGFLGFYDLCKKIVSPLNFIVTPLSNIYAARFIECYRSKNNDKTKKIIVKFSLYLLIIQVVILVLGCVFFLLVGDLSKYSYLDLNYTLIMFVSVLIVQGVGQQTWWCRPFSSAVDPKISIYANLLLTVAYILIVYPVSYVYKIDGFLIAMPLCYGIIYVYWFVNFRIKI